MKLYKSASTLSVARFYRILDTNDYCNLIIGYNYENDKIKLNQTKKEELITIFEDIYFEYCEMSNNHKLRATLKKQFLIDEWTTLFNLITRLINIYLSYRDEDSLSLINNLNDKKYKIDLEKPINPQITALKKKMIGLKNKIKIYKIKLSQSIKDDKEDVKIDLDEDALYLEKNLDLKRGIDPEETSLSKWVKMINMSKTLKKQRDGSNTNR